MLWATEVKKFCKKEYPNGSRNQELKMAIMVTEPEVKDAVIEKWLTYCKSQQLTEFCRWRQQIMLYKMTKAQITQFKNMMSVKVDLQACKYKYYEDEEETKLNKIVSGYGDRIGRVFPLLNPDLEMMDRITKQKTWNKIDHFFITGSKGDYTAQE